MAPFDEKTREQAHELLRKPSGTKDLLVELTSLAQTNKIEKSEIPEIITALQSTIDALKLVLKPESSESGLAREWATSIKENGAVFMHGKLHPYWFGGEEELPPVPIHEPGYQDFGHINVEKPKSTSGVSPNGDLLSGISSTTKVLIRNYNTQYLILSPPVNPDFKPNSLLMREMDKLIYEEGLGSKNISTDMQRESKLGGYAKYCENTLNGKFKQSLREISFMCWADSNQTKLGSGQKNMVSWRGDSEPIPVELNIFMPEQLSRVLYTQMTKNPKVLMSLIKELYPKTSGEYPMIIVKGENIVFIQDVDPLERGVSNVMKNSPQQKIT